MSGKPHPPTDTQVPPLAPHGPNRPGGMGGAQGQGHMAPGSQPPRQQGNHYDDRLAKSGMQAVDGYSGLVPINPTQEQGFFDNAGGWHSGTMNNQSYMDRTWDSGMAGLNDALKYDTAGRKPMSDTSHQTMPYDQANHQYYTHDEGGARPAPTLEPWMTDETPGMKYPQWYQPQAQAPQPQPQMQQGMLPQVPQGQPYTPLQQYNQYPYPY